MRRINRNVRGRMALLSCLAALVAGLLHPTAGQAPPPKDCVAHPACRHCGMDRTRFAHSRLLITYEDGRVTPTCSLHCVALDLAVHLGEPFRTIQVGDYDTRELLDAESARWVLGGRKPGVMTQRPKWAFASREAAERFIRENGGELTDFAGALKAAYVDMYDFVSLRARRPGRP